VPLGRRVQVSICCESMRERASERACVRVLRMCARACVCTRSFSGAGVADRSRFRHVAGEPIAAAQLSSWHVANLPVAATAANVTASFRAAMPISSVELVSTGVAGRELAPACNYETVLHAHGGNAERPYAHVTAMRSSRARRRYSCAWHHRLRCALYGQTAPHFQGLSRCI